MPRVKVAPDLSASMAERARVPLFLFISVGSEVAAEDEHGSLQGFWQRVSHLFLLPADRTKAITSRSRIKHLCPQDICRLLFVTREDPLVSRTLWYGPL